MLFQDVNQRLISTHMPKLYPHDQEKVDRVLSQGVYRVDRKPFRPLMLLLVIFLVLGLITLVSYWVAAANGFV